MTINLRLSIFHELITKCLYTLLIFDHLPVIYLVIYEKPLQNQYHITIIYYY